MKIRASWGKVGDMQSSGNYSYIPTIDHNGPYEGLYAVLVLLEMKIFTMEQLKHLK